MPMEKKIFVACIFSLAAVLSACATGERRPVRTADGMIVIPAGSFLMGFDSGMQNERPMHEVYLDSFSIDEKEVSAAEFAEFLNAKGNPGDLFFTADDHSAVIEEPSGNERPIYGQRRFAARKGFENFPANNVSWEGANAFCSWKGKRLPSEAEWEKAAKGEDLWLYPWGDALPDSTKARYNGNWDDQGIAVMVPVDSLPSGVSPYGLLNMAGNVKEWVADWYRQNYCDFCDPDGSDFNRTASVLLGMEPPDVISRSRNPDVPPRSDTKGPAVGAFKVLRGGSWKEKSEPLRSSFREWLAPAERSSETGLRCAR